METIKLTIDNKQVEVAKGTNLVEAAASAGIRIPTLCYMNLHDLGYENKPGACRICVVEVEGRKNLAPACKTVCTEGMVVRTHTPRVVNARRTVMELILSNHPNDCLTCTKNGHCELQRTAQDLGIREIKYRGETTKYQKDMSVSIVRDMDKCIMCRRCETACNEIQSVGVLSAVNRGFPAVVSTAFNDPIQTTNCINCGQCVAVCPTGALSENSNIADVLRAIADPSKTVVVQTAPAVRVGLGQDFGFSGRSVTGKMVTALRRLGFDYVFDTDFAADLTIMEEGTELLNIVKAGETDRLPLFTSCCPGWVNFARTRYPESIAQHLSSAKSPMQMFGAVVKTWFAEKNGLAPEKIFSVALMPCTAKKVEVALPGMSSNPGVPDMDASLTTREFARMIAQSEIDVEALEDVPLDDPLDKGTGAGVIFGTTGGVMTAALRTAAAIMTGSNPEPTGFEFAPAAEGPWKEAVFDLAGTPIRCAVVHGLANTDQLIAALDAGTVAYDFIEVMACPSGCAGGGGQPIDGSDRELGFARGAVLHTLDTDAPVRFSHENPVIETIYAEYFGEPGSERAEELLHVHAH